ncbi:MAG: MBL fold metallo-hydrolase [Clostridia bacterium]|nr:MBL fold metallo-hydrolase [Clostridia bacterium]
MKTKKILKVAAILLAAILLGVCLVITFANDPLIPTWDNIFVSLGLKEGAPGEEDDFIVFLDVDQGDGALIVSNGQTALIDGGEDEFEQRTYGKIRGYNVTDLDLIVASHIHSDHIAALPFLMERLKTGNIIIDNSKNRTEGDIKSLNKILGLCEDKGTKVFSPVRATVINVGDFELTVLGFYPELSGENNHSIFTVAKIGETKVLFTGDAENGAEKKILNDGINVDCDILKVGHHGSKTSSSEQFLSAATPDYAVISCGENNKYSHPNDEILTRLKNVGAEILRTDLMGDIVFTFNGEKTGYKTEK